MEDGQPIKIDVQRLIGSSLVVVNDFAGDLFTVFFMLVIGIVVAGRAAAYPPHEQWEQRGQDGEDGDGHGLIADCKLRIADF